MGSAETIRRGMQRIKSLSNTWAKEESSPKMVPGVPA